MYQSVFFGLNFCAFGVKLWGIISFETKICTTFAIKLQKSCALCDVTYYRKDLLMTLMKIHFGHFVYFGT